MVCTRNVLVYLCCFFAVIHAFPKTREIYVSPKGDDGALGTIDEPVASLVRARNMIREIKKEQGGMLMQPVNVYLRGGMYFLDEPFVLEAEDSSHPEAPITYMRYPGDVEASVLSGGILVSSQWFQDPSNPNIWQTKLPNVAGGTYYPKQLWVNGVRQFRARLPNLESNFYWAGMFSNTNPSEDQWGFYYNASDPITQFYNLPDVSLVMFHSWTASHHTISHIFTNNNSIYFENPTVGNSVPDLVPSGRRYYIENVQEGLDEAGEWYLDSTTGLLSVIPQPGVNMSAAQVITSNLGNVLVVQGVTNNAFESITVEHNEWYCPPIPQPCDGQAATYMNTSAVYVIDSSDITFTNVTVQHTGTTAIWLVENVQGVMIDQLETSDLGAGGVRIGSSTSHNVSHNTVQNSYILDGGHTLYEGMGVLAQLTSYNTITHNEIGHFTYTGVSVGWSWGYQPSSAHNNTVSYNHIYDIGRDTLSDMGGVYTLGVSYGSVIYNNLIHDVYSYNYGGWGLYPDEGSSDQVWANNIVYNTKCAGLHQHYGENSTITNNIFAFNGWSDGSIRTDPGSEPNSLSFTKNIIYATNSTLFYGDWQYRTSNNYNMFHFNDNIYFSTENNYTFGDALSFAQWQASGQDPASQLADPQFVSATAYNFELQSTSPALALGFVQIDMSTVGPETAARSVHPKTNKLKIN